jgi:transcriptional regulator with XRE-family HTH domain/tetratricopeptide (TPR) repeat protein
MTIKGGSVIVSSQGFGGFLRQLRLSAQLTQEQLAERARISSRTVRDLERGAVNGPRPSTVAALADALQLTESVRTEFLDTAHAARWTRRSAPTQRSFPAAMARSAPPETPRQLPADDPHFTGRLRELDTIDELLPAADRNHTTIGLVTIVGPPGVGKTALAVRWGNQRAARFPDGQLFLNLRGHDSRAPVPAINALTKLLHGLGLTRSHMPTDEDSAAAVYRSLTANRRILVVLDNARSPEQVRPLLPGGGGVVLVTSRHRLEGLVAREGAGQISVDILAPDDALILLQRMVGKHRVAHEYEDAVGLVDACGRLPLALRIAGAKLATRRHMRITDQLASLRTDDALGELTLHGDEWSGVRTVFDHSYELLDCAEQRMFRLLAVAPLLSFTIEATAVLADLPAAAAARIVRSLQSAHLLNERTPAHHQFHDLVRAYGRGRSAKTDTAAEVGRAHDRLLLAYLSTVDTAARLMFPERLRLPLPDHYLGQQLSDILDRTAAHDWLSSEHENVVQLLHHAAEHGPIEMAWLLADALRGYFWQAGHTAEWLRAAQAGHAAARLAGAADAEGMCLLSIAQALIHQEGRLRDANRVFADAAAAMRRANWTMGEIAALGHLAVSYVTAGRVRDAMTANLKALDLCRAASSKQAEAFTLQRLAHVSTITGHLEEALPYALRAHEIFTNIGDQHGIAYAMVTEAAVHRDANRLRAASAAADEAMRLASILGQPILRVIALNTAASIDHEAGNLQSAVRRWEEAVHLTQGSPSRPHETEALNGLAVSLVGIGELEDARRAARTALENCSRFGLGLLEGDVHLTHALVELANGNPGYANRFARRSLAIHRRTGNRRGERQAMATLREANVATASRRS